MRLPSIHRPYVFLSVILFLIEVLIATFLHDGFIRTTVGDFLVVILIYCLVKTCWDLPFFPTAIGVLVFSYVVEMMQYLHLIDWLGLSDSRAAQLIFGTSFSWEDMLAYTLGIACVLGVEFFFSRKMEHSPHNSE